MNAFRSISIIRPGPALESICRDMPQPARIALWESVNGKLHPWMRLSQSCQVKYCGKLAHMIPAERRDTHFHNWVQYRPMIQSLGVGEYIDLPEAIAPGQAMISATCSLRATVGLMKIQVRALPYDRGIRVYRVGEWMGPSLRRGWELEQKFPIERTKRPPHLRPAIFWLGQFWDSGRHTKTVVRPPKCKVPACPHPTFHCVGDYCYMHNHFFNYPISMTDRQVDMGSIARPGMPLTWQARCELAAEYPRSIASLERSLNFEMANTGFHRPRDDRHKNLGNDNPPARFVAGIAPAGIQHNVSSGRKGYGHKSSSSRTTPGKHRAAARGVGKPLARMPKGRWTRETFESLEREADKLLGLDSPEVRDRAELMQELQTQALDAMPRIVKVRSTSGFHSKGHGCQGYEILEEVVAEDEEREQLAGLILHDFDEVFGQDSEG